MRKPLIFAASLIVVISIAFASGARSSGGVAAAQSSPSPGCLNPPTITYAMPVDNGVTGQGNFNCFAWQEFVALNWQADAGNPGAPDPSVSPSAFGVPGTTAPVVWQSYEAADNVFLPGAATPGPFGSNDLSVPQPCSNNAQVASFLHAHPAAQPFLMISKFDAASSDTLNSIGQAGTGGAWLTSRFGKLVYYDVRMNRTEYDYIVSNQFYNALYQAAAVTSGQGILLPNGSIEVKSAWTEITDQSLWPQFLMIYAPVIDYTEGPNVCRMAHLGLVGLHIIQLTKSAQQFAWATFEHEDNDPDANSTPGTYTFNRPTCVPSSDPYQCQLNNEPTPCASGEQPPSCDLYQWPIQVYRGTALQSYVTSLNDYMHGLIAASNPTSVFAHYDLVNVMWPNQNTIIPPKAMTNLYNGNAQPTLGQGGLANTTLETYFQAGPGGTGQERTCLMCHIGAAIARQPNGQSVTCSVTTIQGQQPPGPCATDYSFLFQMAQCPTGVSCGGQALIFRRLRTFQVHAVRIHATH